MGQFAGPVIFYLLEILTTGQFAGQLSKIFSNSWGQFAIGPVAKRLATVDLEYGVRFGPYDIPVLNLVYSCTRIVVYDKKSAQRKSRS